jgi:hypothetical protein
MNDNKNLDYDLLNNFNKFNMKMLKLTEIKIYINNKIIAKFNFYAHHVYNNIMDIDFKQIKKINLLNLDKIDIEFYTSINGFFKDKNCIKIYIYSKKYLNVLVKTDNNKSIDKINIIPNNEILPEKETSYLINNQSSTVLNDEELNILDWINN